MMGVLPETPDLHLHLGAWEQLVRLELPAGDERGLQKELRRRLDLVHIGDDQARQQVVCK